jgi:hypothetical protein
MNLFAQPMFALAFELFILCGETCLHIEPRFSAPGDLSSWPIYVWVAGLFLVFGATKTRRDALAGRLWLIVAWAFNASLLFGAFLDLLGELLAGVPPPQDEWIPLPVCIDSSARCAVRVGAACQRAGSASDRPTEQINVRTHLFAMGL